MNRLLGLLVVASVMVGLGVAAAQPASASGSVNLYVTTNAPVNERWQPTTGSNSWGVVPSGATVLVHCWVYGQNINGDTIWYFVQYPWPGTTGAGTDGYITGYYLNTGHDPNPNVSAC